MRIFGVKLLSSFFYEDVFLPERSIIADSGLKIKFYFLLSVVGNTGIEIQF